MFCSFAYLGLSVETIQPGHFCERRKKTYRFVRPSGAGTNLKVGRGRTKMFLGVVPLHLFGSTSTAVSRFGERFSGGQYSLVSFLFAVLLHTVPPCPTICKSGGTCPRAPCSRRRCSGFFGKIGLCFHHCHLPPETHNIQCKSPN